MSVIRRQPENAALTLIALAFIVWGGIFIFKTSFIAIDGRRYFCLFDDAMISMRYAWNFSHGAGLVWNAGEYVQGYTNLLMTLLMSLATFFLDKSMAALSIQMLGVILMLAIAILTSKVMDHFLQEDGQTKPVLRLLAFAFALSYYPLNYWTLTGMETGLLTVLLLGGVLYAFRYGEHQKPIDLYLSATFLGLAFLTRNDSIIFAVLIGLYVIAQNPLTEKRALLTQLGALFLYSLFVAGVFLFQAWYYGEALPNTYILKLTGMAFSDRIANGLGFILPFLVQVGLLLIPATVISFVRFRKDRLLLLACILLTIGYQIYVGGDPWQYWRMISPAMPLLGILFLLAVDHGVRTREGLGKVGSKLFAQAGPGRQVGWIAVLGILVANAYFLPEILFLERPFYVSANQHNVNIAVALNELTTPQASVGVFWAGAIPYFTDRKAIDFLGKSDRYIAGLPPDMSGKLAVNGMKSPPGHNKYDLNYSIKSLQPTYVQDFVWGTQDLSEWGKARYVQVEYKGTMLYLLKNSPAVDWEKIELP